MYSHVTYKGVTEYLHSGLAMCITPCELAHSCARAAIAHAPDRLIDHPLQTCKADEPGRHFIRLPEELQKAS